MTEKVRYASGLRKPIPMDILAGWVRLYFRRTREDWK